jgi:hypothetical protein
VASIRTEIPAVAFETPLAHLGLAEHVYNILTEAEYETIGDLMLAMRLESNKVLGLAGIGPKAMQNIESALVNVSFPEPAPPVAAETAEVVEPAPEVAVEAEIPTPIAEPVVEPVTEVEIVAEAAEPVVAEAAEPAVAVETEEKKEAVSLEEMFTLRPEIFKTEGVAEEEEESGEGEKKEKKKKKHVELVFDEKIGEVVSHKKHKRADGWDVEE